MGSVQQAAETEIRCCLQKPEAEKGKRTAGRRGKRDGDTQYGQKE